MRFRVTKTDGFDEARGVKVGDTGEIVSVQTYYDSGMKLYNVNMDEGFAYMINQYQMEVLS